MPVHQVARGETTQRNKTDNMEQSKPLWGILCQNGRTDTYATKHVYVCNMNMCAQQQRVLSYYMPMCVCPCRQRQKYPMEGYVKYVCILLQLVYSYVRRPSF